MIVDIMIKTDTKKIVVGEYRYDAEIKGRMSGSPEKDRFEIFPYYSTMA